MSQVVEQFLWPVSPVLCLVFTALVFIGLEGFPNLPLTTVKSFIAKLGALGSIVLTFLLWQALPGGDAGTLTTAELPEWIAAFQKSYILDSVTLGFYFGVGLFLLLSLVIGERHFGDDQLRSETELLLLFIACGMQFLVSAGNLIVLFLGLELLSLPLYVLVGVSKRSRESAEAALKYFLFGSLASVFLILGITLLYAQFGTFNLAALAESVNALGGQGGAETKGLLYAGLAFMTISAAFKVGLVPFHMWVPDAYQGAPTPITGFMGSAVKLVGFALILRVIGGVFLPLADHWSPVLETIAIVSMFLGNLAALRQDNLKRLFAYSSIAHAGYLLLGIVSVTNGQINAEALYYYLMVYGVMFIGIFAIIALVEQDTGSAEIYHLSGLGFTYPTLSFCLVLLVLSAAGIPPTAGFLAKYFIFLSAVQAGKTPLVVMAVISSIIGAYYYLRVLVYLYMKESKQPLEIQGISQVAFACIVFCAVSMIYFSLRPQWLFGLL